LLLGTMSEINDRLFIKSLDFKVTNIDACTKKFKEAKVALCTAVHVIQGKLIASANHQHSDKPANVAILQCIKNK
jgi:hypothetical protein